MPKPKTGTTDFRVRKIENDIWAEFKILCIKKGVYPNDELVRMIVEAVKNAG